MTATHDNHIIIGMSGGVDSSVAAWLLLQQGYQVEGLFMKNWEDDDTEEYCSAAVDLADAQQVCDKLRIPLHTVNFSAEYWDTVFDYFLKEFKAGRTPNPDILCNREIKFRAFLDYAVDKGADKIATGHYARVRHDNDGAHLLKGKDRNKDQSYFLHAIDQSALARSIFPLGDLKKQQVRAIAEQQGFANAKKKDSTGICFIGERKFKDFLGRYLPAQPGDIITLDGEVIGRHDGLMFYTIGQRQGLGIGGLQNHHESPWFVARKNLDDNTLLVVQGHDHPALLRNQLVATDCHWLNRMPAALPFTCMAKTRYRQPDQTCTIEQMSDNRIKVNFSEFQRAITPGQSVVFYQDDECLGGGIISDFAA